MTLEADRVMIFHPYENNRFIKNHCESQFQWTGEFIGEVSGILNEIPALKGNKLYYLSPANQYVMLQRYDVKTHTIELIKRIYGLPMIPYNLCLFKNKQYIMYSYTPFNEIEYSLWRKKKEEITDGERYLFFFHWMLGVKGKIVRAHVDMFTGGSVIMSSGKYSAIDFVGTDMTQTKINKFFGDYRTFQNTGMFFNRLDKIDEIRNIISQQNYWWFQEIEKRIRGQVISQPSLPYAASPSVSSATSMTFCNFNFNPPQPQSIDDTPAIPFVSERKEKREQNEDAEGEGVNTIDVTNNIVDVAEEGGRGRGSFYPIFHVNTYQEVSPDTRYSLFQQPTQYKELCCRC